MEVVPAPSSQLSLSKRALLVIAPKDFQDKEYSRCRAILKAKGVEVLVASTTTKTTVGMGGMQVNPDLLVKNARAADYDAVVFIGGRGAATLANDPQVLALAIEAKKHNKIIGAICIAPVILAKASVLEGKKATVSPRGKGALSRAGATFSGKEVEVDGKVITASGAAAADAFGEALLDALLK